MRVKSLYFILCVASLAPSASVAGCRIAVEGTACVAVPQSQRTQAAAAQDQTVKIGTFLERGKYSIMMNAGYYGLEPVQDGWVYMEIDHDVYRVDFQTFEVLERVTDQTNYYWR